MADILIRDVDPAVHEQLKAQARANGQTLQAYLTDVLAHRSRTVPVTTLLAQWARDPISLDPAAIDAVEALDAGRRERDDELAVRVQPRRRRR